MVSEINTINDLKNLFTQDELRRIDEDYIFWWEVNQWGLRDKFVVLLKGLGAYDND